MGNQSQQCFGIQCWKNVLSYAGRYHEAIEFLRTTISLDPLFLPIWLLLQAHVFKVNTEIAVTILEGRIRRNPETKFSRLLLASCYGRFGRMGKPCETWYQVLGFNLEYSLEQKPEVCPSRALPTGSVALPGCRTGAGRILR